MASPQRRSGARARARAGAKEREPRAPRGRARERKRSQRIPMAKADQKQPRQRLARRRMKLLGRALPVRSQADRERLRRQRHQRCLKLSLPSHCQRTSLQQSLLLPRRRHGQGFKRSHQSSLARRPRLRRGQQVPACQRRIPKAFPRLGRVGGVQRRRLVH